MAWTEEQKQAARERMKAMHAKKKAQNDVPMVDDVPTKIADEEYSDLKQQIEELKKALFDLKEKKDNGLEVPQVTARGVIGTFEKYSTDPSRYPDPTERLYNEPKLKRFAFRENYELNFAVNISSYETLDGRREKQPKFTLQLIPKIFEDDGQDHGRRYIKKQIILHEDPDTALFLAKENGLDVDEYNEKEFLDEMRYLRMRDWLLEDFYPPKTEAMKNRKQTVINNQVVEIYETSSEQPSAIPFQDLRGKIS